jgi:AcrR family transcriptional regulator
MPVDKRRLILEAAGRCFARYGYEKTTMEDVGTIVGMNKVSLYYYFKSKEALFGTMMRREEDGYLERMKREARQAAGCRKRIGAWIRLSFRYGASSGVLRQASAETQSSLSPFPEELRARYLKTSVENIALFLEEGRRRGEIGRCNAEKVAESIATFIAASKDAAFRKSAMNQDRTAEIERAAKSVRFAVDLILDGLEARAVPPAAATKKGKSDKLPPRAVATWTRKK